MNDVRDLWKDAVLDVGLGRKYGHTGEDSQDCVRLVLAALQVMYPLVDELVQRAVSNAILLVGYPLGSYANLSALVDIGIARWVDAPPPGSVCIVQEWWETSRGLRGHCYSHIEPVIPSPEEGKILHSTNATFDWYAPHDLWARLRGKRHRMVALIHPFEVN